MDATTSGFLPEARSEGLIVRELADELLVYDLSSNKAHCLNQTAALVWRHCNGRTTITEVCHLLEEKMHAPADEQVVWFALDQLAKNRLLEKRAKRPPDVDRLSRRALIRRVGVAVSIPLVASIVAPSVALAVTCTTSCSIPTNPCIEQGCANCVSGQCHT